MPTTRAFRAKFVAPMDQPIIRDGIVAIESNRIVAVGPASDASTANDLGEVILMPGLINAHTHLELTLAGCQPRNGATFVDWLHSVRQRNKADAADAVRAGIDQCIRFGVTTVGDITQQISETRATLAAMQNRPLVVSFGEAIGLAKRRARFDQLFDLAIDDQFASQNLVIGLSPHAPYTVDKPGYEQCLRIARERKLPLATHLAEHPAERAFLESHTGEFRQLWEQIDSWQEPVETYPGSPINFAASIGVLDFPTLLAHVNYCDDDEMKLLSRGRASVVYCPRTHRYFDHPPHRWCEMLERGINVALGTDSCASSADLNIVDEIRLLNQIAPDVSAQTLWEMITIRGAKALRMENEIGSITVGKRADLIAFAVGTDDPLNEILQSAALAPASLK